MNFRRALVIFGNLSFAKLQLFQQVKQFVGSNDVLFNRLFLFFKYQ